MPALVPAPALGAVYSVGGGAEASRLKRHARVGFGLTYVPEGLVQQHIAKGRFKRVLEDWCPPFSGYHLWYPSRRQSSAAFALVVEALRYRN